MATEIVRTPCVINIVEVIAQDENTVGDSSDWAILSVGMDERVCSFFRFPCISVSLPG